MMDNEADTFATNLWFTLIAFQLVFFILRMCGIIRWHWLVVLIPLCVLIISPLAASIALVVIRSRRE